MKVFHNLIINYADNVQWFQLQIVNKTKKAIFLMLVERAYKIFVNIIHILLAAVSRKKDLWCIVSKFSFANKTVNWQNQHPDIQ